MTEKKTEKKPQTIAEMVEAGKNSGIKVTKLNEPNMRLMAEAALNMVRDKL